jgi:hypothetical protein
MLASIIHGEYSVEFGASILLGSLNNRMHLGKDIGSTISSEASAYLLLDLYFPYTSFTDIVVKRYREVFKEFEQIDFDFIDSFFEGFKFVIQASEAFCKQLILW